MTVGLLVGTVTVGVATLVAVTVTIGVTLGVVVSVGTIPIVGVPVGVRAGVAPGVDVSVGVIPTVGVFVAVTVGVLIAVGVTVGRAVAVNVTVGVTAGSVGDGVGDDPGVTVTLDVGVFCRRAGVTEALVVGSLLRALLLVTSTCGVYPCDLIGLARQDLGEIVGVVSTGEVATEVGAVAVIKAELTTRVSSPPVLRPCANSDPQALPTVTKSRDILIHIQKKVTTITIKRPLTPLFHRAINVSIISLLSFPPIHIVPTGRFAPAS